MSDLEGKKKKLDEEIEMLDKSFEAGNLTKSQYDLQMQEKTKEKEEIIEQQQLSQDRKDSPKDNEEVSLASEKKQATHSAEMETIAEPKLEVPLQKEGNKSSPSKEGGKSPKRRSEPEEESNRPPLEDEGEKVIKEPSKQESKEGVKKQPTESEKVSKDSNESKSALTQKEADKTPSVDKLPLRVEIKEPEMESEKMESASSSQLPGKSKGRRRSSIKEIGKTLRRASIKERRISMKESSDRGIVPEESPSKADGTSEPTPSNEQPAEVRDEPTLEEAKETSKSPSTGQESEEPTVTSREPDMEGEKKPEIEESEEPTTISNEPDAEGRKPMLRRVSAKWKNKSKEDILSEVPVEPLPDKKEKGSTESAVSAGSAFDDKNAKLNKSAKELGAKTEIQDNKKEEDKAEKEAEDNRRNENRDKKNEEEKEAEQRRKLIEKYKREEADKRKELQQSKDEILNEIKKLADPELMKKTFEDQKTAMYTKLREIQLEIQKLESEWKDMGFFGPVVSAVAAMKKRARDRELDESGGRKKRRLEIRLKELENEKTRRIRRLARIQSQINELEYSLREKIIEEAEYNKGKENLLAEKASVDEEGRLAEEELHRTLVQIKLADKIGSEKRRSTDPEEGLIETKLQLEKQVEQLNNQISEKKRKMQDEGQESDKTGEGIKDETRDKEASRPPAATAEKNKADEEVETLERMRDKVEDELVGIKNILEKIKGPRQRMMLWGAVAAVAMIYLHEFSKTFMVVH